MAIQKPEWFKVDPAKFLSDAQVDAMSTVELGACFRLLCRQWLDGSIPDDLHLLGRLCRLDADPMGEAWVTLCHFFPLVETGKRANRYMWIERDKVLSELERRSDEGTRAALKRWDQVRKKKDATPNGLPMPNPMGEPMQDQTQTRHREDKDKPPLAPQGAPTPSAPDSPRRKRRSREEILSGYGEGVKRIVSELLPVWPGFHDPEEKKPIRFDRAAFALKVSEILTEHKSATPELLLAAGHEYLSRKGEALWWKGPEFFFGPQGPWLGIVKDLLTSGLAVSA